MSFSEILEIADSVKRTSHRVKNSGDIALAELGLKFARKVKKQTTLKHAKTIEKEYLWVLKEKYFPIFPQDKILPTITSMAGYDAASTGSDAEPINTEVAHEGKDGSTTSPEINHSDEIQIASTNSQIDLASQIDKDEPDHYSLKSGEDIELNSFLEDKLKSISDDYYEVTGKEITVTDGIRQPEDQAREMIQTIEEGNFEKIYTKPSANEVIETYKSGKENGDSDSQIEQNITNLIIQQREEDLTLYKHVSGKGFDLRSNNLNDDQREAIEEAVKKNGGIVVKEGDHIHVQFND